MCPCRLLYIEKSNTYSAFVCITILFRCLLDFNKSKLHINFALNTLAIPQIASVSTVTSSALVHAMVVHLGLFNCLTVKPGVHTNDFAPIHRQRALKLGHASLATVFRPGRLTFQQIPQENLESPLLRYQPITTAVITEACLNTRWHHGDVMQALPDSSHDQTCDKNIVDTYYLDNCQTKEIQTIDAEQVNQFIVRLKRGKAPGSDGIYHEHLIFGNSQVLCASLASLYTGILSTA